MIDAMAQWAAEGAASKAATLGITRSQIATTKIPATVQAITVSGTSAAGDTGAGAVYVRGTSGGARAIQDATQAWWNLAISGYAERAWFGASGSTNTATAIAAVEADGGGILHFAPGVDDDPAHALTGTWPQFPNSVLEWVGSVPFSAFSDAPVADAPDRAKRARRVQDAGAHSGAKHAAEYLEFRPRGSGINGPNSADYGKIISVIKHDWLNPSCAKGELDAMYLVVRNGGPDAEANDDKSDGSGFLGDIQNVGNSGFVALYEASVSNIRRSDFAITRQIAVQSAPINSVISGQSSYGHVLISKAGANDVGYFAQCEGSGTWVSYALFQDVSGNKRFEVKDDYLTIGPTAWVRNQSGQNIAKVSNNFWQYYNQARTITGSFGLVFDLDLARTIRVKGSSPVTINLPNNGSVGWWCDVLLEDSAAGPITFSPASGASLVAKSSHNKLSTQYGRVRVEIISNGDNVSAIYELSGDTSS
ncbi:hypothetical protein V5F79_17550 [Xanthobacter flavus]|uniref:hypothetical protein n=1 Tax=Xanthobacter flavus TaxID=281 RepID=UPI0037291E12